jgi:hypothetical protein
MSEFRPANPTKDAKVAKVASNTHPSPHGFRTPPIGSSGCGKGVAPVARECRAVTRTERIPGRVSLGVFGASRRATIAPPARRLFHTGGSPISP